MFGGGPHKDPSPAFITSQSAHLHKPERKNAGESANEDGYQVECRQSDLHFVSHVPTRDKVYASREKAYKSSQLAYIRQSKWGVLRHTGFEKTQKESKNNQ